MQGQRHVVSCQSVSKSHINQRYMRVLTACELKCASVAVSYSNWNRTKFPHRHLMTQRNECIVLNN